ncbi:MAG UNVERIFIED_CONTAM: hypothetical protein LVR18_26630 [Planctomycetaceae bacterium]
MTAGTDFRVIPEADQLGRLKRDLAFHPANAVRACTLNQQQIEDYNRNGFVRRFRAYSPEQIAEIRRYFDRLLETTIAAGGNSYSISTCAHEIRWCLRHPHQSGDCGPRLRSARR